METPQAPAATATQPAPPKQPSAQSPAAVTPFAAAPAAAAPPRSTPPAALDTAYTEAPAPQSRAAPADEETAAPISTSATQQSSLPVAWQQAGLTERPRDPPAPAPAVTPPTTDQAPVSPHPADQPPSSALPEQKKRPASELRDPSLEGLLEAHACPAKRHDSKKTNLCAQLGIEASQQGLGRIGGKLAGHIGENRYVAGLAEDGRSKCQSILCRAYLAPGEPRIGKRAPSCGTATRARRSGTTSSASSRPSDVLAKSPKTITSVADLEGFESLLPADQQKVRDLIVQHNEERGQRTPAARRAEKKTRPPKKVGRAATKKSLDEPKLLPPPRRSGRTAPRSYDDKAWEERSPSPPEEGASLLLGLCAAESPAESDSDSECSVSRAEASVADAVASLAAARAPQPALKLPPATLAAAEEPRPTRPRRRSAAYAGADPARAARAGAAAFEQAFAAIAARGDLLFDSAPSGGSSVAESSAAS